MLPGDITLIEIALALILAKVLGTILERVKQPAVIGEILAGIFLGAMVFPSSATLFHMDFTPIIPVFNPEENPGFYELAGIGVILLLFTSGVHTNIESMKKMGRISIFTAVGGVIFPFTFGMILGHILGFSLYASLAAGTIFTATSIGVTARTLMELDLIDTDVATIILTTAVIDDVIAILILSLVFAGAETGGAPFHILFLGIGVFFLLYLLAGLRNSQIIMEFWEKRGGTKTAVTFALALAFVLSAMAELVSLAAITGAFLAGILVGKSNSTKAISENVEGMARLFFIPLFFVSVGTLVNFESILSLKPVFLLFIPLAIAGKVIGCGLGSIIGGLDAKDSMRIGFGMMPKMEIALVVVTTAISMRIFTDVVADQMLTVTVLHIAVTALLTAIIIKRLYSGEDAGSYW